MMVPNCTIQMAKEFRSAGGGGGGESVWFPPSGRDSVGFHGYGTLLDTDTDPCISCTTFNILAPIYKRLDKEDHSRRESQFRAYWLGRNQKILDKLLTERSSIICLQEVWIGNEELVDLYETRLGDAGYMSMKLARTNNRGDGLLTAVHRDCFRLLNYRELLFNDIGDRVAQLLHIELLVPFFHNRTWNTPQQMLIVNTHLLFPHNHCFCIIRLHQVHKILQYVESYQKEHDLISMPIILCGDWNGSKRGYVYKFLRSQGFVSSYDTAHQYTDSDADAHKWVSHRNHHGNICGVDFIWLLNPNKYRKSLRTSWNETLFGMIKHLLRRATLTEESAFAFLKGNGVGDYIIYQNFCQALRQLGLAGHPEGLNSKEMMQLWIQADQDGNGIVDQREFQQVIWNSTWLELSAEDRRMEAGRRDELNTYDETIVFDVKTAILFPPEVEQGTWPENYSLSDHAPLTVVFCPRTTFSSHWIC